MSLRFRICLLAWIVVVASAEFCKGDVYSFDDGWSMNISPAAKLPAKADQQSPGEPNRAYASQYSKVYNQIPFNRAEYNVNPSYRHDSAMEILTGNARHKTVLQHSTAPAPQTRYTPSIPAIPYRYNNPRRGLNYYFYFPYWNYRGIY